MARQRTILAGIATLLLVLWFCFAWSEWRSLLTGYQLGIGIASSPDAVPDHYTTHVVVFPTWRKALTLLIAANVAVGGALLAFRRRGAIAVLAVGLVLALAVGAYDFRLYGTLGSPTSYKSLLVLGALAFMASREHSNHKNRNVA